MNQREIDNSRVVAPSHRMEKEALSIIDLEEADASGAVPRIAGIRAPAATAQIEDSSEGRILGQVSSIEPFDFRSIF